MRCECDILSKILVQLVLPVRSNYKHLTWAIDGGVGLYEVWIRQGRDSGQEEGAVAGSTAVFVDCRHQHSVVQLQYRYTSRRGVAAEVMLTSIDPFYCWKACGSDHNQDLIKENELHSCLLYLHIYALISLAKGQSQTRYFFLVSVIHSLVIGGVVPTRLRNTQVYRTQLQIEA